MAYSEVSLDAIDLNPDLISYFGPSDENYESLYPSNAIALLGDIFNLNIVLFSFLYRGFLSGVRVIITGIHDLHLSFRIRFYTLFSF